VSKTGCADNGLDLSSSMAISRMRHIWAVEARTAFSLIVSDRLFAVLVNVSTPSLSVEVTSSTVTVAFVATCAPSSFRSSPDLFQIIQGYKHFSHALRLEAVLLGILTNNLHPHHVQLLRV
jgi:hypothetical protein